MNVSLTPELERLIRQRVESGLYTSASEVVREALRLLEERDKLQSLRFEELLAAKRDGPERVVEPGDEAAVLAANLAEYGRRRDRNPMKEARMVQELVEKHGWSQARISKVTGLEPSQVSRSRKLLKLPEHVREQVEDRSIKPNNGYQLTMIEIPEEQMGMADSVALKKLVHADLVAAVKIHKVKKNRQEIQVGLDQADRGEVAPLDVPDTLANVRRRRSKDEEGA
jgi:antitoxin ParD1/3/4